MAKGKYKDWLTKDGLTKLQGWARDGLTDEQIAKNIGIVRSTLYDWENKYSVISDALKKGKEVVDMEVENALLKRALGYSYNEETVYKQELNGTTTVRKEITKKEMPPHPTAQIFWLKNRRPDKWRDQVQMEHSGNMNVNNPYEGLTTEELKKLIEDDK